MRHVSRTHRVTLDWLFDRISLDPKIQIKCSILAISVLQFALIQWRNDLNKIQEKSESQQNRDLWWIFLPGRRRSYRPQLQSARGRDITEVKIHGDQLLEKTDRGDLIKAQIYLKPPIITTMSNSWKTSLQQVIQNWMTTVFGLLKSGENWDYDVRSIRATWWKFLENGKKSSTWSRRNSSRRNRAIRKERRNTSW